MTMNHQRHRRKESFSILFLSNTGERSKQFYVSRLVLQLSVVGVVLICLGVGWLIYQSVSDQARRGRLQDKLTEQEKLVSQLESEKQKMNTEKAALAKEVDTLRPPADSSTKDGQTDPSGTSVVPKRYPCSGSNVLASTFTTENPYLTLMVSAKSKIVAAGSGTVSIIGSNASCPVIVEITHENGYRTRYMCHEKVNQKVKPGARVKEGDILFTITKDETLVDYQVVTEQLIDPLSILDAKG